MRQGYPTAMVPLIALTDTASRNANAAAKPAKRSDEMGFDTLASASKIVPDLKAARAF